ncbi:MAG TPA: AmmeMemoRadiSam system radical SAM enzyme, partial [Methanocorpusculum sp.]|nr:AmmeMemoRadiSam system radical SAM enzyme [Methanocorpusculum sp.]
MSRHPARLWKVSGDKIACGVCAKRCMIAKGERGFCGVRVNTDGILYADSYGLLTAANLDPIEKKPLYQFLPGTTTFSISGFGCNFTCKHCQNYTLSQTTKISAEYVSPETVVLEAVRLGAQSISFTYNEPTISFEYVYDTAKLAKEHGLTSVFVTNGYISAEALRELAPYLGAIRIDLKAFTDEFYRNVCGARLKPVLDTILLSKELGLHVELITLVIPGYNDSVEEIDRMLDWVMEHLGPAVPHHFTAFMPMYQMQDVPRTPFSTLDRIFHQAKEHGLYYPYVGNMPHDAGSKTFCPECGELLIDRGGRVPRTLGVKDGLC